jgi:hypothetical protein
MCCESLIEELDDFVFPDDEYEGPAYHKESIASLNEVIRSIETFLDTSNEQAYSFFFQTASQDHIDLIGWMCFDGIYRRVKREKAQTIFECCCEWGFDSDWRFSGTPIGDQDWVFDIEQIDMMMNKAVKHQTPFSIQQFKAQLKSFSADILPNEPNIQNNINVDFDKKSPTYPPELDAALQAWREASKEESKRKPKERIGDWLNKNTKLSKAAKNRIKVVANWDKIGGATRTD